MSRDTSDAEGNLGPVHGSDVLLPPLDRFAEGSIVVDALGAGEGRHVGHVDDLLLEGDGDDALVEPEGDEEAGEDGGWEEPCWEGGEGQGSALMVMVGSLLWV